MVLPAELISLSTESPGPSAMVSPTAFVPPLLANVSNRIVVGLLTAGSSRNKRSSSSPAVLNSPSTEK